MFHFHLFATLQHPLLHILVLFVLRCTVVIVQLLLPSHVQLFATQWMLVPHNLAKFSQVHVHCINDAIQPSHLLKPSSISALNLSSIGDFSNESEIFPMSQLLSSDDQNTGIPGSASVLAMSIQGWFPLRLTGLMILLSKRLSGMFSNTTVQRYYFFGTLPSLRSGFHNRTWPLGRLWPWLYGPLSSE